MRTRTGFAVAGLVVASSAVVAGCGHGTGTAESGRWESQVSGWGLDHADSLHVQDIWRREVHRQHVQLDAVVSLLDKGPRDAGSEAEGCPPGPLLRIVIRGTFPAQPSTTKYEDLYASRDGHVCAMAYRVSAPRLKGVPSGHLQRTYDVPDSG